jgi:serine/threonine protein phosphatase 1
MPLTFAVGDIHGCLDKLKQLVASCLGHADGQPAQFVFLGDYIDRGPDCAGVIRYMLRLQEELGESLIALKGNHEAWALEYANGWPGMSWLRNGGSATLKSYGAGRVDELPRAHLDWLGSLRLSYDDGQHFFVHAGVDPERPLDDQDEYDLLWIREPFLTDQRDYGRLIVHGHTPLEAGTPELYPNRLNIDTAAVFGGPLTAAMFNESQREPLRYLQAR